MTPRFEVGDRVQVDSNAHVDDTTLLGLTGTIVRIDKPFHDTGSKPLPANPADWNDHLYHVQFDSCPSVTTGILDSWLISA